MQLDLDTNEVQCMRYSIGVNLIIQVTAFKQGDGDLECCMFKIQGHSNFYIGFHQTKFLVTMYCLSSELKMA